MRVLTAVWAALLAVAWGSPVALAQSDGRETYGPVAATRGKPKPDAKPQAAKPQVAKPRKPPSAAARRSRPKTQSGSEARSRQKDRR